jgi:hypothetical protein
MDKFTIRATIALVVIACGVYIITIASVSRDHRAEECRGKGGIWIESHNGAACLRKDAVLQ